MWGEGARQDADRVVGGQGVEHGHRAQAVPGVGHLGLAEDLLPEGVVVVAGVQGELRLGYQAAAQVMALGGLRSRRRRPARRFCASLSSWEFQPWCWRPFGGSAGAWAGWLSWPYPQLVHGDHDYRLRRDGSACSASCQRPICSQIRLAGAAVSTQVEHDTADLGKCNRHKVWFMLLVCGEVVLLASVEEWFLGLCETDPVTANRVMEAIDHLTQTGPGLGRPMADRVHGSRLHNLKELRPGSTGAG